MTATQKSKIIVALDYPDAQSAMQLVEQLVPDLCRLKVGKELFTRSGPALVEALAARGFEYSQHGSQCLSGRCRARCVDVERTRAGRRADAAGR
jgi:hypothetical protein